MNGKKNLSISLAVCLLLTVLVYPAAGRTIYVDPNGSADFTTIQEAIDDANDDDEIEVAPGTYNEAINFNGKAIRLYSSGGPEVTTIDANGLNSSVVLCGSGEDKNTVLQGFTITGGKGTTVAIYKFGGGMYNVGGSPTVTNCTFSGNSAYGGGGMGNYNSSPTVTNCTFSVNTASNRGGGMYNNGSSPTVTNCTFTGNVAELDGGGMHNYHSSPTVTNCTFTGNVAELDGGGMLNDQGSPTVKYCCFVANNAVDAGGGMYNWDSSPTVTNCTFQNNSAVWGGGMYNVYISNPTVTNCTFSGNSADYGGGVCNSTSGRSTVTNCTFANNDAFSDIHGGGGMANFGSSPAVTDCNFSGNSASYGYGGGMYNSDNSTPTVTNCTFSLNTATRSGGGVCNSTSSSPTVTNCTFSGNTADEVGSGMLNYTSSPTVTNCTFTANTAALYGGGMGNWESSPTVTNCIFWADEPNEIVDDPCSTSVVTYSDVQGGWSGTGNIDADPCFVDVTGGDLRLWPGSPCIDAGDNNAPGMPVSPRIVDGDGDGTATVDMGAYEWGRVYNITRNYSYLSIQPAIDDANDADELLVTDGTYRGADNKNLDLMGKAITLRSATGPENCIIDCESDGRGFYVLRGEGPDSLIENFTIINAGPANTFCGGGICFVGASPTVRNCIIKSCSVPRRGAGIYCSDSNSLFENCAVLDCNSGSSGGGICCENGSNPTFVNCLIALNYCPWDGGGMLCFDGASATIINSTFTANRTSHYGAGISSYMTSHPILVNCIIWANDSQQIYAEDSIDITFSDVQGGWSGAGNIDADPCFVDADANDWRLLPSSPCVDSGDNSVPGLPAMDLAGNPRIWDGDGDGNSVVDMGALEYGELRVHNVTQGASYAGIQKAINEANDGDEIEVDPATYKEETIDFKGKAIRLYSANGPNDTIIDGTGNYHVVQCVSGEDANTILEGFTITGGDANGTGSDSTGGGMYNFSSSPTVTNCTFNGNAAQFGGGMYNYDYSTPTVSNCTFSLNTATRSGGGVCNSTYTSPTITNCTFYGNTADEAGGGIHNYLCSPTVTNCTFTNNVAFSVNHGGGGMCNWNDSSPTVINCMFSENLANGYGGGMYNYDNSSPTITNCLFSGNTSDEAGGGMHNYLCSPMVTNCILWSDSPDEIYNNSSSPTVTYCDVQGGYGGTGNINQDPCFVDADANDWRLLPSSPCVDTGDNSTAGLPANDLDGHPRIIDGDCDDTAVVDMGAYEFNWHNAGDFDNNCFINFFDFSISARYWMTDESFVDIAPRGGDGIVDFQEVAIIADNWLAGTTP